MTSPSFASVAGTPTPEGLDCGSNLERRSISARRFGSSIVWQAMPVVVAVTGAIAYYLITTYYFLRNGGDGDDDNDGRLCCCFCPLSLSYRTT